MSHESMHGQEPKYEELLGTVTFGEQTVEAIQKFAEEVSKDIRLGLLDAADYADFKGAQELADKLRGFHGHIRDDGDTILPVPESYMFSNDNVIRAETSYTGGTLGDELSIHYFDRKTGKIICYDFGPDFETGETTPSPDADSRYCYVVIADGREAGEQHVKILYSTTCEGDKQVDEMLAMLLAELAEEPAEPTSAPNQ